MKKKLLSLVLAGAMVASTSVSAFAATTPNTKDVTTDGGTTNVTINGSVDTNLGQSAAGTINVSVPTAMNFKVDKSGNVSGGEINITNHGTDAVDVTAIRFEDTTPNTKITVKTTQDFEASENRSNLVLSIGGNKADRAYFKSEEASSNDNGIYDKSGNNQSGGIKISTIEGNGNSDKLTLDGFAGEATLDGDDGTNGITDKFILTLKVTKAAS